MKHEIEGHTVEISSPDKILFPADGLTKADLVNYYIRIAPALLPHIHNRPISMQRFPNGINEPGFYQKEAPDYFPEWVRRVEIEVKEEKETQPQVVVDSAATLAYLANQGCITPHAWLSRAEHLGQPDKLIFDLDPPGDDFGEVRFAALTLREILNDLDLPAYLMTTGSRGLHIAVPLEPQADFDTVREFARNLAEQAAQTAPDRLTTEVRKNAREGRLFLDYLRNAYAQTAVTPYAVRARAGAPVATPLNWEELDASDMDSQRYNLGNIFRRLGQKDDPWQNFFERRGDIRHASRQLQAGG